MNLSMHRVEAIAREELHHDGHGVTILYHELDIRVTVSGLSP